MALRNKTKAAAGKTSRSAKPQSGEKRPLAWLQGLVCGALAMLAPPLALLLAFLLAPGLIGLLLDKAPGRPIARTVLLFGLAASVGPARLLWNDGITMPTAVRLISDPFVIGTAWAAAAAGWLVAELVPFAVTFVLDTRIAARSAILRAARNRHAEEWGITEEQPAAE